MYDMLGPRSRYVAQQSHRELNLKRCWVDFLQKQPISNEGFRFVPELSTPEGDEAFARYLEDTHIKPKAGMSVDDLALTSKRRVG